MHMILLPILAAIAFVAPSASARTERSGAGTEDAPFVIEIPDSARTVYTSSSDEPLMMEGVEITARRIVREAGADRIEVGTLLLDQRDGGSVSDLGTLLPSTQLTVNSRGEALFLVRGAQERHLRVELDGIPLTVPWDERTDLSLLPLIGVGGVVAHRGVSSALDPPNTLAGRIEMTTRRQRIEGHMTRLRAIGGEAGELQTSVLHQRRDGSWTSTLALEHRRRDGFLLSGDSELAFHQDPTRRLRLNTDLEQSSALVHLGLDPDSTDARLNMLIQASTAQKGIAPEAHLDDARFWRYPATERLLFGLSGDAKTGAWKHEASLSLDLYQQEVERYTDATYSTIDRTETNDDRALLARARTEHALTDRLDVAVRGSARNAHHEDDQGLEEGGARGATREMEQNLLALGAEATFRADSVWTLRAGAGYEGATTPKTGDKPSRDGDHEAVVHAAVEFDPDASTQFHANASRRPRFVSMRELFSEALGRFVPNPDLGPEIQNLFEVGGSRRGSTWEVMANGFWAQIEGSIEQAQVPGGRQRVNLEGDVRSLGLELGFVWRPINGLTLDAQYTEMRTRAEVDGDFDGRLADRPDRLATLGLQYVNASGALLRGEVVGAGVRYSFDDTAPADDPLTALDPSIRMNLRFAWRDFGSSWYQGSEVFARVDNVLDADTKSQIGLPESGRTLRLGLRVDLGS